MIQKPDIKDATPEQKKEIYKTIRGSFFVSVVTAIKFSMGLFLANGISYLIGLYILKDTDPEMKVAFQFVSTLVNFVFMMTYLSRRISTESAIVNNKIKEILKDKTQEGNVNEE